MKKRIMFFIVASGILLPKESAAMLDVFNDIVRGLEDAEEAVTSVVNVYGKFQVTLQELTSSFEKVKKIKNDVMAAYQQAKNAYIMADKARQNLKNGEYMEFFNTQINNLQWPGINAAMKSLGEYVSPNLQYQVADSYFRRKNVEDDVVTNKAFDLAHQSLLDENVATDYANALVRRVKLQEESAKLSDADDKDETNNGEGQGKNSSEDLNSLLWRYGEVMRRANHHWQDIVLFEASNLNSIMQQKANGIRIDDLSEVIGENEKVAAQRVHDAGHNKSYVGSGGVSVQNVISVASQGIQAIKNKNYSSAVGTMSSMYNGAGKNSRVADTISNVSSKIGAGYSNWESGNYGAIGDAAANEVGGFIFNQQKKETKDE